jgi:hypothetical protein
LSYRIFFNEFYRIFIWLFKGLKLKQKNKTKIEEKKSKLTNAGKRARPEAQAVHTGHALHVYFFS